MRNVVLIVVCKVSAAVLGSYIESSLESGGGCAGF